MLTPPYRLMPNSGRQGKRRRGCGATSPGRPISGAPDAGKPVPDPGGTADDAPARATQARRLGIRFRRALRPAVRVFWIAVFVAVFLIFGGVLG
jgi:hypothetical protein